jgi:hypothetical protein
MLNFFKKKLSNPLIDNLELTDWWQETFNQSEVERIIQITKPENNNGQGINFEDKNGSYSKNRGSFLAILAGWIKKVDDRTIAYRLLEKAVSECDKLTFSEQHFIYLQCIQTYYRWRNEDDFAKEKAVFYCKKQIAINEQVANEMLKDYVDQPLPSHTGFEQLSIIYEKDGEIERAIELVNEAKVVGWAGEWDKRLLRLHKRAKK